MAMKVYDVTAGYPGTLVATVPMTDVVHGTYGANFTPLASKEYVVDKMAYTDGTFVTPDTVYSPGSEPIRQFVAGGGSGMSVCATQLVLLEVESHSIVIPIKRSPFIVLGLHTAC